MEKLGLKYVGVAYKTEPRVTPWFEIYFWTYATIFSQSLCAEMLLPLSIQLVVVVRGLMR